MNKFCYDLCICQTHAELLIQQNVVLWGCHVSNHEHTIGFFSMPLAKITTVLEVFMVLLQDYKAHFYRSCLAFAQHSVH